MGRYPDPRGAAMKVQEVITRAASGQLGWWQAAEILGSPTGTCGGCGTGGRRRGMTACSTGGGSARARSGCRWGPWSRSCGCIGSAMRISVAALSRELTASTGGLSYSWVKHALQTAGLVPRRRKRARIAGDGSGGPCPGCCCIWMPSRHAWVPGDPTLYDLVSVSDDATNELYYAVLVPEENTREVLRALRAVVRTRGVFCALYTDRASHFIHTPPAATCRIRPRSSGRSSNWASS